jgi:hypothetical protein
MFSGMAVASCSQLSIFKKHTVHKTLTMSNKCLFFRKKLLGNGKLQSRIFVSAEYSADNFWPNTRPKTFSVDHYFLQLISVQRRKNERVKERKWKWKRE